MGRPHDEGRLGVDTGRGPKPSGWTGRTGTSPPVPPGSSEAKTVTGTDSWPERSQPALAVPCHVARMAA